MKDTFRARRKGRSVEFDSQILRWRRANRKLGLHLDKRTVKKRKVDARREEAPMSYNLFYSGT